MKKIFALLIAFSIAALIGFGCSKPVEPLTQDSQNGKLRVFISSENIKSLAKRAATAAVGSNNEYKITLTRITDTKESYEYTFSTSSNTLDTLLSVPSGLFMIRADLANSFSNTTQININAGETKSIALELIPTKSRLYIAPITFNQSVDIVTLKIDGIVVSHAVKSPFELALSNSIFIENGEEREVTIEAQKNGKAVYFGSTKIIAKENVDTKFDITLVAVAASGGKGTVETSITVAQQNNANINIIIDEGTSSSSVISSSSDTLSSSSVISSSSDTLSSSSAIVSSSSVKVSSSSVVVSSSSVVPSSSSVIVSSSSVVVSSSSVVPSSSSVIVSSSSVVVSSSSLVPSSSSVIESSSSIVVSSSSVVVSSSSVVPSSSSVESSSSSIQLGGTLIVKSRSLREYKLVSNKKYINVMVFSRDNGEQREALDITSTIEDNKNGTYTYSYSSKLTYGTGKVEMRFFAGPQGKAPEYFPGPGESGWYEALVK